VPAPLTRNPRRTLSWRDNLIEDNRKVAGLLADARRIAVVGMKTEQQSGQPAFYVPEYLHRAGFDVIPVPVYYPEVQEILGIPVVRRLAEVEGPVDLVILFRRSIDVPRHLDDILALRPGTVWMQSGIRHPETAERLAREGIRVVQDRCAMIEHRAVR
jgi:uncharacterized protein